MIIINDRLKEIYVVNEIDIYIKYGVYKMNDKCIIDHLKVGRV
jgi:hypothetical protein